MTDKLTEMRRDLERGLAYWRGENDDSDVQCERCLAEHLPALLELVETVMTWWEASGRAREAWIEKVPLAKQVHLDAASEKARKEMYAALAAFADEMEANDGETE